MSIATSDSAADRRMILGSEHPERRMLNNELHARPITAVEAPAQVLHFAVFPGGADIAADRLNLASLCRHYGTEISAGGNHFAVDLAELGIKWERHAEFCTYTLFFSGALADADTPINSLPPEWLEALKDRILVATRIFVLKRPGPLGPEQVAEILGMQPLAGSQVLSGRGGVWTDFRIQLDGFSRFLLVDQGLRPTQGGRIVQRLIEIETYRMMALLALPLARSASNSMSGLGAEISEITSVMADAVGMEAERMLLARVMRTAAEIERLISKTSYRLSASAAYDALVKARLAELREVQIEGIQTFGEFLERRFAPAMQTCRSVAARQESLSQRISRTAELLRTRVDIALEDQNRSVLESMSRRAELQLRMQETVEGLSIFAISYYLVGLIGHFAEAFEGLRGMPSVNVVEGVATPLVIVATAVVSRRVRRRLMRPEKG